MELRIIGQETSDQRRGRTGRTCPGAYLRLQVDLPPTETWPNYATMRLAYNLFDKCIDLKEWVKQVKLCNVPELSALLVQKQSMHWSNFSNARLMQRRFESLRGAQGDPIAMYLMPHISKEWINVQESTSDEHIVHHHFTTVALNKAFCKAYASTYEPNETFDTEAIRKEAMGKTSILVRSEMNYHPDREWLRCLEGKLHSYDSEKVAKFLKFYQKKTKANETDPLAAEKTIVAQTFVRSIEPPELADEENVALISTVGVLGTLLVIGGGATMLINQSGTRFMTKVSYIHQDQLARYAKTCKVIDKDYVEKISVVEKLLERIKLWMTKNWHRLKMLIRKLYPNRAVSRESAEIQIAAYVDAARNWILMNAPSIATVGAGISTCVGVIEGLCADTFVKVFGPVMGSAVFMVAGAAITILAGVIPGLASAGAAAIVYAIKNRNVDINSVFRTNQFEGRAGTTLLVSSLLGVGLGTVFCREIKMAAATVVSGMPGHAGHSTAMVTRFSIVGNLSWLATCKQLYYVYMQLLSSRDYQRDDIYALAANLISIISALAHANPTHFISVVVGIGLLACIRYIIYNHTRTAIQVGGVWRDAQYMDWRNLTTAPPAFFDNFVCFLGLVGDPTSIVSVLIMYLDHYGSTGDAGFASFMEAFQRYSGVDIITTLFLWAVDKATGLWQQESLDVFGIVTILLGLPATISWYWSELRKWYSGEEKRESATFLTNLNATTGLNIGENFDKFVAYCNAENPDLTRKYISSKKMHLADETMLDQIKDMLGRYLKTYKQYIDATADVKAEVLENLYIKWVNLGKPGYIKRTLVAIKNFLYWLAKTILNTINKIANAVKWVCSKTKNIAVRLWNGMWHSSGVSFRRGVFGMENPSVQENFVSTALFSQTILNPTLSHPEGAAAFTKKILKQGDPMGKYFAMLAYYGKDSGAEFGTTLALQLKDVTASPHFIEVKIHVPLFVFRQNTDNLTRLIRMMGAVKVENGRLTTTIPKMNVEIDLQVSWDETKVEVLMNLLETQVYFVLEGSGSETMGRILITGVLSETVDYISEKLQKLYSESVLYSDMMSKKVVDMDDTYNYTFEHIGSLKEIKEKTLAINWTTKQFKRVGKWANLLRKNIATATSALSDISGGRFENQFRYVRGDFNRVLLHICERGYDYGKWCLENESVILPTLLQHGLKGFKELNKTGEKIMVNDAWITVDVSLLEERGITMDQQLKEQSITNHEGRILVQQEFSKNISVPDVVGALCPERFPVLELGPTELEKTPMSTGRYKDRNNTAITNWCLNNNLSLCIQHDDRTAINAKMGSCGCLIVHHIDIDSVTCDLRDCHMMILAHDEASVKGIKQEVRDRLFDHIRQLNADLTSDETQTEPTPTAQLDVGIEAIEDENAITVVHADVHRENHESIGIFDYTRESVVERIEGLISYVFGFGEFTEEFAESGQVRDDGLLVGFDNVSSKPHQLGNWHDTVEPVNLLRKRINNSVSSGHFLTTWSKVRALTSRYNKKDLELVNYADRVYPPNIQEMDSRYASRSVFVAQCLDENFPSLIEDSHLIYDVCSGAGGFTQYISYKGTQKGARPRLVCYSTKLGRGHSKPIVDTINLPNSKTMTVLMEDGDDSDIRRPSVLKRYIDYGKCDLLIVDAAEGDSSPIKGENWLTASIGSTINNVKGEPEFNSWVEHYNKDPRFGKVIVAGNNLLDAKGVLAHAVSADFKMDKGVARQLKDKYGVKTTIWKNKGVIIYSLVVKENFYDKPSYLSLYKALKTLPVGVPVSIPRICCGLDKLNWMKVSNMLDWITINYDIHFVVYGEDEIRFREKQKPDKTTHTYSFTDSVQHLTGNIIEGGRMVCRMSGINGATLHFMEKTCAHFKRLTVWRSPTTGNHSPAWYLIASAYGSKYLRDSSLMYEAVIAEVRNALTGLMEQHLINVRNKVKSEKSVTYRNDWFKINADSLTLQKGKIVDDNEPNEIIIDVGGVMPVNISWKAEWRERSAKILKVATTIRKKKVVIKPYGRKWKQLFTIGTLNVGVNKFDPNPKYITNGFIFTVRSPRL